MTHTFYKTKPEITKWLNSMEIENYKLIKSKEYGFLVDVEGDVDIEDKGLKCIPIKFNVVKRDFNCSSNKLTSLVGCPSEVSGRFYCENNKLASLQGITLYIKEDLFLNNNCHISIFME